MTPCILANRASRPRPSWLGVDRFRVKRSGQCSNAAARAMACDAIQLSVWSGNLGAQRFYARHGFSKVGEHTFPVGRVVDLEFTLRREKTAGPA